MAPAKPSPAPWDTGIAGFLHFQQSYLQRVSDYADGIRQRAASGSVEPGEWIADYSAFLSGVIADAGDLLLGPARDAPQGSDWLPVYREKLRLSEGATTLTVKVPRRAFEGRPGADPTITLMTDGLVPRGGGALLERRHVKFHRELVARSKPRARLRVFGVRDVGLVKGAVYSGVVWAKETRQPIAAVELKVL